MRYLLIILITLLMGFVGKSQEEQSIESPSEGKVLIYFVRASSEGSLVNFKVFHEDQLIGISKTGRYFTYEVEPGEHLFWATSENKDFLEATFEANKTYVINVEAELGFAIARAKIHAMNPEEYFHKKRFHKIIRKHKKVDRLEQLGDKEYDIDRIEEALEKYEKRAQKNSVLNEELDSEMNWEHANKPTRD